MKAPVRVAVTGAAGQIGYALLFRIASGAMLGPDQPVILQLLEITPALKALDGVHMELDDCAFPLLQGVVKSDDPNVAFADTDYAMLVGAFPRKAGMERSARLDDVIDVDGGAGHMLVRGIVTLGGMNATCDLFCLEIGGMLGHGHLPHAARCRETCNGAPLSCVSAKKRRKRFFDASMR